MYPYPGKILEIMKDIRAVGDDLKFNSGRCGKAGQLVPVKRWFTAFANREGYSRRGGINNSSLITIILSPFRIQFSNYYFILLYVERDTI